MGVENEQGARARARVRADGCVPLTPCMSRYHAMGRIRHVRSSSHLPLQHPPLTLLPQLPCVLFVRLTLAQMDQLTLRSLAYEGQSGEE